MPHSCPFPFPCICSYYCYHYFHRPHYCVIHFHSTYLVCCDDHQSSSVISFSTITYLWVSLIPSGLTFFSSWFPAHLPFSRYLTCLIHFVHLYINTYLFFLLHRPWILFAMIRTRHVSHYHLCHSSASPTCVSWTRTVSLSMVFNVFPMRAHPVLRSCALPLCKSDLCCFEPAITLDDVQRSTNCVNWNLFFSYLLRFEPISSGTETQHNINCASQTAVMVEGIIRVYMFNCTSAFYS